MALKRRISSPIRHVARDSVQRAAQKVDFISSILVDKKAPRLKVASHRPRSGEAMALQVAVILSPLPSPSVRTQALQ
jgi:hypothetical protein